MDCGTQGRSERCFLHADAAGLCSLCAQCAVFARTLPDRYRFLCSRSVVQANAGVFAFCSVAPRLLAVATNAKRERERPKGEEQIAKEPADEFLFSFCRPFPVLSPLSPKDTHSTPPKRWFSRKGLATLLSLTLFTWLKPSG